MSAAGGLKNAVIRAQDAGMNAMQGMFSAPMRWSTKEIDPAQIEAMAQQAATSDVKKILFHGVYLTNLARQDKQMFHVSKLSVATHVQAAHLLQEGIKKAGGEAEVLGVTFHPGSAKDCTPEEGVKRIAQGLDWIAQETDGGMILLESSAGSGSVMGDQLEELAAMRENCNVKDRVGYVLDTQHMFVSGYDWVNDLEGVVSKIESILGLENVKSFHLNDSKQPFNSHKDRHADLGEGEIGLEAIKGIVNHPKLMNIPFILETPSLKTDEGVIAQTKLLQSIAKE